MALNLSINGEMKTVEVDPDTPLLWVLRDHLGMVGTKFGCGIAQCGACTVQIDGQATRSCQYPVSAAEGVEITTIEALEKDPTSVLQDVWVANNVPQCGYCQAGMLMAASALLKAIPKPTDADIDAYVDNICRCGTYHKVRAAIHEAAAKLTA